MPPVSRDRCSPDKHYLAMYRSASSLRYKVSGYTLLPAAGMGQPPSSTGLVNTGYGLIIDGVGSYGLVIDGVGSPLTKAGMIHGGEGQHSEMGPVCPG